MANTAKVIIKADDKTKAAFKSVKSGLDGINSKVALVTGAVATLAGAGGFGLLVRKQSEAIQKANAYSRALDVQIQSLTAWQSAGHLVNIENDKMADIFKDLTEKIGDAVTGGGEAVEVLEKLGINITDIAALSPDQQLLKIASSLEKIGTTGEKVQILESLASDSSLLLPLLEDNAKGFIEARDQAERYGAAISEIDAQRIQEANIELDKAQQIVEGLANKATSALAPVIERMAVGFQRMVANASDFFDLESREERLNELFSERFELVQKLSELEGDATKVLQGRLEKRISDISVEMNALAEKGKVEAEQDRARRDAAAARKAVLEEEIQIRASLKAKEVDDNAEEKERTNLENSISRLRESLLTKEELLAEHLQNNEFLVEDAFQQSLINEEQRKGMLASLDQDYQTELTQITADEAKKRVDIEAGVSQQITQMKFNVANQAVGLLKMLAGDNKKAQKAIIVLEKGLAIAQVKIQTEVAAMRALAELGPVAGPPAAATIHSLGITSMGLIAATGLAQLGGAGGGSSSLGNITNTPSTGSNIFDVNNLSNDSSATGGSINIHINNPELLSDQSIGQLVDGIKDQIENRDVVLISADSRNGQELVA